MIVELANGYYVDADEQNYTLKQKYIGKTKDKVEYEAERIVGYFGNLINALNRYVELEQIASIPYVSNDESLFEAIQRCNKHTVEEIKNIVSRE